MSADLLMSTDCEADMHAVCDLSLNDAMGFCECPCHINMVNVQRQANADKLDRIGDLLVEGQPGTPTPKQAAQLKASVTVQGSDMHYLIALMEGFYGAVPDGEHLLYQVQLQHETWKGEQLDKLIEKVPEQMEQMKARMVDQKAGSKLQVARGVPRGVRRPE